MDDIQDGWEKVSAQDGVFEAYYATPRGASNGCIVMLQEIFGVTETLRSLARDIASQGYLVLIPDLFWRLQPRVELAHDRDGMKAAFGFLERFDEAAALGDIAMTVRHGAGLCGNGPVHLLGFCLGGKLATRAAADKAVTSAIAFYGVGIETIDGVFGALHAPIQLHFGDNDRFIPADSIAAVRLRVANDPLVEVHTYEGAEHAFFSKGRSYHPVAAEQAWARALAFMKKAGDG
jgi:carboxymethylenebutenolidase